MSTYTAWCRAGHWPTTAPGIRPSAPLCSRCGHCRGICAAASSVACGQTFEAGQLPRITDRNAVDHVLQALMGKDWVVYSKPCLARAETVVDYLGRYTHRTALSDRAIAQLRRHLRRAQLQDYADGNRRKVMTLTGEELLARVSAACLAQRLHACQKFRLPRQSLPGQAPGDDPQRVGGSAARARARAKREPVAYAGHPCPACGKGTLRVSAHLAQVRLNPG